jgi:hypothetical protein
MEGGRGGGADVHSSLQLSGPAIETGKNPFKFVITIPYELKLK